MKTRWDRKSWAGLSPNGIGKQKPNHYLDMVKVAYANRRHPVKAWRIIHNGVCDGCALGVAGLHDWTIDGIHLCTTRLKLLETNTADAVKPEILSDVEALQKLSSTELRKLGRLAHPMRRRAGERGFRPISWDTALDVVADAIKAAGPDRTAIYLTSRGITNETYYVAGKAARAMGIASIDSAARTCHAPSTVGLKGTIGVAASTCSLQDVLETDLIVLWGANVANNQPVFMKYLYLAKKNGARVVVVNPFLEPGLERYWVPSNLESAVFGTKICDLHIPVRPGGDVAFANAVLKRLIARNAIDRAFVEAHTEGWDELETALAGVSFDSLLSDCGLTDRQLESFVDAYADAKGGILIWSMGITQHRTGVDNVMAIVNVGLARGNVGRDGAGLMPIRGHSGVQGGAEMGAYASALPGGVPVDEEHAEAIAAKWGFEIPLSYALTAGEQIEAAERGELDVLFVDGGNFLEVMPDPDRVRKALANVPLRVHQDIVISSQMLVPGEDVILFPAATRYEQDGGGTETTTERRIAFSPQIGAPPGEARSEWRIFGELASRVRPDLADRFDWPTNLALREEIADVVPLYAGIETLRKTGDAVQWGGRHLCVGGEFPTPSGKGRFSVTRSAMTELGPGEYFVSTRRGRQFNSMVFAEVDPLTGAQRDTIYLDRGDAAAIGVGEGDLIRLTSATGQYDGRAHLVRLPARSIQVHWPEGNVLLPAGPEAREPGSKVPDYNTVVKIEVLSRANPPGRPVKVTLDRR
ncbi:MAG: FdhF/YdeP family oxidoreductase [Acidimicrobiia bacterium]